MKKIGLLLLFAFAALAISAISVEHATALPAFNKQFAQTYAKAKGAEGAKAAKCNLCHVEKKKKKVRNEYGKALSKFVTKADYKKLKEDKPALKAKIEKAFEEAGKMKSSAGETFAERIKAGKLPAAK
jgi:cytochrome c553